VFSLDRRTLLRAISVAGVAAALPRGASAQQARVLTRPVPSSGEALPLVGLGSWITFNVGKAENAPDESLRKLYASIADRWEQGDCDGGA
jgi:hypothetical protein